MREHTVTLDKLQNCEFFVTSSRYTLGGKNKLRIESCRKCGIELKIRQNCSVCKKPIKFECGNCKMELDEQIHSICRLVDMNYRPMISEVA